jgi:lipoprotein-anchoring transpeptidase ErfK/SrfK
VGTGETVLYRGKKIVIIDVRTRCKFAGMKKRTGLFLWMLIAMCCIAGKQLFAQQRQADSLKRKQQAYDIYRKAEEEKRKQQAKLQQQAEAKARAAVVMYDSKGNKIESTKDKDGSKVTTTTILIPPVLNRKFSMDTIDTDSVMIRVQKSKHRLQVYHKGRLLTAYKCVFGANPVEPKKCEGDKCTPEGTFTIQTCKDHAKWDKFMLIDYPNEESRRQFEENKRNKVIPTTASIGGLVGIHGIWHDGDTVIDMKHNWTDGCISLKNADVAELSKLIKPGITKIMIVK